jgi:predicted GTPase
MAASPLKIDKPELVEGKKVLVLEDGPTVTHGSQPGAAGYQAAKKYKVGTMVDPRPYLTSKELKEMFAHFTHIGNVLPTLGYGDQQIKDLEETIAKIPCDSVLFGTPIDLRRVMKIEKPIARVSYEIEEAGGENLKSILQGFMKEKCGK